MHLETQIADFLDGSFFAVVGASADRQKYGNKVLRVYQQRGYRVVPVNPHADRVEGLKAVASLSDLAEVPHGISIITPPAITEKIVEEAVRLKIQHVWMQPGAESENSIETCRTADINLIHSGPCLLVVLGYKEQ